MRYLIIKKEKASPEIIIWTKSQYPVEINLGVTRECTHGDYMIQNRIPRTDIASAGWTYHDIKTGRTEVSVLPWDIPTSKEDISSIKAATKAFVKNHPDLMSDVQYEWNEHLWQKRQKASTRHK